MKKVFAMSLIALIILSFALPGKVAFGEEIITLTFEDYENLGYIPSSYAGLNWDPEWFFISSSNPYYAPKSGEVSISSQNFGGYIDFSPLGSDIVFHGAWISGPAFSAVYFEGYKDDVLVWTSETIVPSIEPYLLGADQMEPIDKVVLVSSEYNYFSLDDLMYSVNESNLDVMIDIKPNSETNPFNPNAKGVVPVALYGSEILDVMAIAPESLVLDSDKSDTAIMPLRWAFEDVGEKDGMMDLIMHFDAEEVLSLLGEDPEGEMELMLMGETMEGIQVTGADQINIVPQK